ncbi:hypothetical protein CASFOL_016161 [Castilleja foliolosa]|uniref:Uncharacterized protein n=1 Tax=Castilleja foliolosa TaxID=1961234 RepID=A0ABD3DGE9_9LAMI
MLKNSSSWSQKKHLLFIMSFLALVFISEATRLPKAISWEQMMPKKLPAHSSAPSRGSNSVTKSSRDVETNRKLPSSDGKV